MVVENFLEEKKEITQSSKKEIPSNTYPMTFINKISISNEFA
jgi:hypothetical protein